jgi:uncharacterized protein YuzE
MENIKICDNFLNKNQLIILKNILKNKTYKYGHTSGGVELIISKFFSTHNEEDFFLFFIKNKIEKIFSTKFKMNRHYMHIQTFGQDGGFHIDDEGTNKYTFCIYITDEIDMDKVGGDFLIKIPKEKHILSIETFNNRGILFPSEYLHKGMAYNIHSEKPRLCITWKLEII